MYSIGSKNKIVDHSETETIIIFPKMIFSSYLQQYSRGRDLRKRYYFHSETKTRRIEKKKKIIQSFQTSCIENILTTILSYEIGMFC